MKLEKEPFCDTENSLTYPFPIASYSYGSSKVSCFSWRHKTILVAARPETWQFWSRRELHFSLLDERLSILVATCCYEAPQDLLNSGRQTRQISSRREMSSISWREMRRLVLVPHFSHQLGQIREVFVQVSTLLRVFKGIVLGFEIGFQFCQTVSSLAWQPDSYRAILWQLHKKLFVAFRNLWPFRYFPQQSLYSYASWVVLVSCQTRWSLSFVLDPL